MPGKEGQPRAVESAGLVSGPALPLTVGFLTTPLLLYITWTSLLTSQSLGYLGAGRGTVIHVCRVVFRIE